MITQIFRHSDVIRPDELAILQEVFKALCERERISRDSAAADEIARRIMQLYQSGERNRAKLLEVVRSLPSQ
ncbi:MAG TPA: hypothetical protein VM468_04900 [Mycoplana sp.]|nr:hypothetical protein [Mycoplana sp.]